MAPKGTYRLAVEDRFGSFLNEYSVDSGELLVGRDRSCTIVLRSENVSRHHARLIASPDGLLVEDMDSINGVFVNGARIRVPSALKDEDVIRIGDFRIHVGMEHRIPQRSGNVRMRLVGKDGEWAGQVFDVSTGTTLVGRGRDCGLVIVHPSVSRVHGRIRALPAGSVVIEDLGSANGLFVNGQRVQVWDLSEGDDLRFGDVEFRIERPNPPPGHDTVQVPVSSSILRRPSRKASLVVGMGAFAALAGVAALLVVNRSQGPSPVWEPLATAHRLEADSAAAATVAATGPAPAATRPDPLQLDAVRTLIEARRLDDAERLLDRALERNPLDADAVRLANRIAQERAAAARVESADTAIAAGNLEAALQSLFQVGQDSHWQAAARLRLAAILPRLIADRDRACRGRLVSGLGCVQAKALVAKVEDRLR
jgi:pSer/pThr/pTyr-binding forkhead associated (FHA) protein